LTSPDVALIVERARVERVDAVAIDAGADVAAAVARDLPELPVLRPLWREVQTTQEYRNEGGQLTRVTETVTTFGAYARLSEGGALEPLHDGQMRGP
jgi:hypothetical protein